MLANILRSPMSFFDTTPLGRILNRFSKDVYLIDEVVPRSIRMFIWTFLSVLSTIIVIVIATPIFAVVIVPLGIFYVLVQVSVCEWVGEEVSVCEWVGEVRVCDWVREEVRV